MEGTSNNVEAHEGGRIIWVESPVDVIDHSEAEQPVSGMQFDSLDDLFEFYKKYAKAIGFGIAKWGRRKDEVSGIERWQTITCTKGGKCYSKGCNILMKRATRRCGCKARVCCAKKEGIWVITKVELRHNHELKPDEARFIRQHCVIEPHVRRMVEANDISGIRPTNNVKSVVFLHGGHEHMPCLSADIRNHVTKFRKIKLVGGDAQAVMGMFASMQKESEDFFYFMKHDKEGRLKHVFWADGRCRAAYKDFNDVVTFDTTYIVNKYDMPCAIFVGVNHHGQSILLGCALLNNEKCKTFIWLFDTWLRCMGGKHPNAIITDQCAAIGNAISVVFPNSRHRLCLWHIVCKFPKKFGKRKEYGDLRDAFMDAIYDSMTENEFEDIWGKMVDNFDLYSNEWICQLFESRARWVPLYVKGSFWAGMSTTQKSESMNAFFDGYLNSRTSLQKFVEQYALAVNEKIEKELQLEFLTKQCQIPCVTRWPFEGQLAKVYTSSIFKLVQKEIVDAMYCELSVMSTGADGEVVYEVSELVIVGGCKRTRIAFTVKYGSANDEVSCSCKLFEFRGFLCSHVFKVFITNDVDVIPEKFIFSRWRKDVVRPHMVMKVQRIDPSIEVSRTKALERIFYKAIDIAVEKAANFRYMEQGLSDILLQLQNGQDATFEASHEEMGVGGSNERGVRIISENQFVVKDPKSVKRRGRPKSRRVVQRKWKPSRGRGSSRKGLPNGINPMHSDDRKGANATCALPVTPIGSFGLTGMNATTLLREASEGRLMHYGATQFSPSLGGWHASSCGPNFLNSNHPYSADSELKSSSAKKVELTSG